LFPFHIPTLPASLKPPPPPFLKKAFLPVLSSTQGGRSPPDNSCFPLLLGCRQTRLQDYPPDDGSSAKPAPRYRVPPVFREHPLFPPIQFNPSRPQKDLANAASDQSPTHWCKTLPMQIIRDTIFLRKVLTPRPNATCFSAPQVLRLPNTLRPPSGGIEDRSSMIPLPEF